MRVSTIIKSLSLKQDYLPLLILSLPLILTSVIGSSFGFFENIFLSSLGEHVLAAGALVSWFYGTLIVIIFGIFSSVNVLIAHKYGERDTRAISLILRDGQFLAILLVIPTTLLLWNMALFLSWLGQPKLLVDLAQSYFHALSIGLLPKFILVVLEEFILGLGQARVVMWLCMLSTPLYIFFSYVLIYGKFGLPVLGIAGAGWGISLADWVTILGFGCYVISKKEYKQYLLSLFDFSKPSYSFELIHLGGPIGAMYCLEVGYFFAVTLFMGKIGVQTLAASQVTLQYLGPLMGVVFAIAQAITIRMGHEFGSNQAASAFRAAYAGIIISVSFMCFVAFVYWTIPEWLISVDFDVHDPRISQTIRLSTLFLSVAAVFQIFEAVRISLFGALRSLRDTRFTLLISGISLWCIALPCGYLLSIGLHMGGVGFWLTMTVSVIGSVILLSNRLKMKFSYYHT